MTARQAGFGDLVARRKEKDEVRRSKQRKMLSKATASGIRITFATEAQPNEVPLAKELRRLVG